MIDENENKNKRLKGPGYIYTGNDIPQNKKFGVMPSDGYYLYGLR